MSKMERIDSRSATSAPDDVTTPAIARAAKQPSAPAVRDEAPEVLPKGKGGGAGEQLLPKKTEPQSNPASIRGPATEDQVQRPLAKEAREGGPVPQDRRPDGANSPADKPDGDLRAEDQSGDQVRRSPLRRHPIAVLIGLIFLAVAAAGAYLYWDYAQHFETTDDAFIASRQFAVAPKVSGYITAVPVTDNQHVVAGDVVARIDDRDYHTALEQAQAQVAAAEASIQNIDAQTAAVFHVRFLTDIVSPYALRISPSLDLSSLSRCRGGHPEFR